MHATCFSSIPKMTRAPLPWGKDIRIPKLVWSPKCLPRHAQTFDYCFVKQGTWKRFRCICLPEVGRCVHDRINTECIIETSNTRDGYCYREAHKQTPTHTQFRSKAKRTSYYNNCKQIKHTVCRRGMRIR